MKILAASDIHSDPEVAKKLAEKAKKNKVDLVLLGGDIVEPWMDIKGIIKPFKDSGIEVLMVHGNHEQPFDIDVLSEVYGKGVYNLHSYYKLFGDVVIVGLGGAEMMPFGVSDDDTFNRVKEALGKFKNKKRILLTHEPPYYTKIDNLGWTRAGSKRLRELIESYKPDIVLCGHIHETFGLTDYIDNTKIINAGRKGVILEI